MKEKTKNILAVLSAAFMSFVGILTETSLNVTFPTMMKQFNVALDTCSMDYYRLPFNHCNYYDLFIVFK